jgi:HEAT repeat protein
MSTCRLWQGVTAGVLAAVVLATVAPQVRADRFGADPVEALKQALRTPLGDAGFLLEEPGKQTPDAEKPEVRVRKALEARSRLLTERIQALRNLSDMRRALLLTEWRQDTELRDTSDAEEVDRRARALLADRFRQTVRAILRGNDDAGRMAVLSIAAELGTAVRLGRDRSSITRDFGPDLVQLIKRGRTATVRQTAARALGQTLPDPEVAVPPLREMLHAGDVGDRRAAASGLLGLIQVVSGLASRSKSAGGPEATLGDVVATGRLVVPAVATGLRDPDTEVRRTCAEALEQAASALSTLVPQPRQEETGEVEAERRGLETARRELQPLAEALGAVGPELGRALRDPDAQIRLLALRALEDMGTSRQRLLRIAPTPPASGPRSVPTPGRSQRDTGSRDRLVSLVQNARPAPAGDDDPLLRSMEDTLRQLARGVSDRDVLVRLAALDALETLGKDAASISPVLVRALGDPNRFVRWSAARTLGKAGPVHPETEVPALARLIRDEDLDLALAGMVALDRYGPVALPALPDLVWALEGTDAEMRIGALRALEGIGTGSSPAIPAITRLVADENPRVRVAAANLLGRFGPAAQSAAPALRRALRDREVEVRRAASDALLNVLSTK